MRTSRTGRCITAVGSVVGLVLGTLMGVLSLGLTAAPAGATSSGPIGYEIDCAGTGLTAGNTAPFGVFVTGNTTTDSGFPTGTTFGASGAAVVNVSGAFIAGLLANGFSSGGLQVNSLTIGATNATGSYAISVPDGTTNSTSYGGTTLAGVDSTNGSTTLLGNFSAGDVGSFIAGAAAGPAIPNNTVITAVNAGVSATISNAATSTTTGGAVGIAGTAGVNYTIPFTTTATAFTTAGNNGQTASLNVVSSGGFVLVSTLSLPFDGTCDMTGYDAGGTASTPAPLFPLGTPGQTPLVSVSPTVTPPFATVALGDGPPNPNGPATVNLAVGGSKSIQLTAPDTDGTPANYFEITTPPSGGPPSRMSAAISDPATGATDIADTGSGPGTVTFSFTACDGQDTSGTRTTAYQVTNGGVNCGTPFQVTVSIGTAPVDEPLVQNVNPGQLVLSCSNPDTNGGTPALTCSDFNFPDITLNGLQQTSTGSGSTLYVSDNRGDPNVGWSLSAYMVPTQIGTGSNTNTSCAGIVAFCNEEAGVHALDASGNGQIAPSYLSIGSITCYPHSGNNNPSATAGSGGDFSSEKTICTAAATQSGGTFDVGKTYTLTIPSSVYSGHYWGTVEYLVQ